MRHHRIKTVEPYYSAVARGEKLFEVRRNDRFFQNGDTIDLVWWDDRRNFRGGFFTTEYDRQIAFERENPFQTFGVGPVLQGGQFGIEPGFCVFSLLPAPSQTKQD